MKRNKRKIPPPSFLFRCSFSSFSSTPHYNTAFVVVSASNLHVTRRVEYGERRHWLRGKPVGGARTPHSLSASRGWKRGNKIKKREREAVLAKCQSGGITIFRFEFLLEIQFFYPPPSPFRFVNVNHVFEANATRDSPFLAFKTWEYIFIFCYPSLFIYIFFHCRNEVANKPVVHSVITNALGILFFFCQNFLFFLSFYMFCIASFSQSSKSELITEPVAKASFEIFSKSYHFEFVEKIDFTLVS